MLKAESTPRAILRPEKLDQWKIPMTPSGVESAKFRLVSQCLNILRYLLYKLSKTMDKLDTVHREDQSCRIWRRESQAEFRIAKNHGARPSAAAGASRRFTAPCSVTCEASLHMATVESHGRATDTGLGILRHRVATFTYLLRNNHWCERQRHVPYNCNAYSYSESNCN